MNPSRAAPAAPAALLAAVLAASLLAACGSTPPSRYYTLDSAAPAAAPAEAGTPPFSALAIGPVVVPELIDRPEIVSRLAPHRVALAEFELWAQPLKSEIPRVLAAQLGARWPQAVVSGHTVTMGSAGAARLGIDVLVFEAGERDAVVALAWTLQRPGGAAPARGRVSGTAALGPAGTGQEAAVAALSRALAQAGRALGDELAALR